MGVVSRGGAGEGGWRAYGRAECPPLFVNIF